MEVGGVVEAEAEAEAAVDLAVEAVVAVEDTPVVAVPDDNVYL